MNCYAHLYPSLLPILWAVVSTAVALILYKTGSGEVRRIEDITEEHRRVRLRIVAGGSFGLFVITSGALYYVTPSVAPGYVTVSREEVETAARSARNLKADLNELGAIVNAKDWERASKRTADAYEKASRLQQRCGALVKLEEKPEQK